MPIMIPAMKIDDAIKRYCAGESLESICRTLHVDFYAIKRAFASHGIPIRTRTEAAMLKQPSRDISYVAERYAQGETMENIRKSLHLGILTVRHLIIEQGGIIRKCQDRRWKEPPWAEDMVSRYVAGESLAALSEVFRSYPDALRKILKARDISIRDFRTSATLAVRRMPKEWRNARGRKAAEKTRKQLDNTAIVNAYLSGESENSIAKRMNVSRDVITKRLQVAGIQRRNTTEANRLRQSQRSPEERRAGMLAAQAASRGRTIGIEEKTRNAQKRQAIGFTRSKTEPILTKWLADRGLTVIPQQAIGPYNVDIGTFPIAVEVLGGGWHRYNPLHAERTRYILNAGWHLVFIWVNESRYPLQPEVTDYIISFLQEASRNPSMIREYRVIRGNGQELTRGSANSEQITLVAPGHKALNGGARD